MVGGDILIDCLDNSTDRDLPGPGTGANCIPEPDIHV